MTAELWIQSRGFGFRVSEDTALAAAAEAAVLSGGPVSVHTEDCDLGRADYETNPAAGTCTCEPFWVAGADKHTPAS